MKTEQTGSRQKPGPFDDTLAIIIKCQECHTQRAFRVNDSFGVTITRQSSGAEYSTWCEKCGRRISVQLAWTKRHKGWPAEKILFEDAVTVVDQFGLTPEKGQKLI
jgi:hypothetical protein